MDKNRFLTKIRFYSLQRFILRLIANVIIPFYYIVTVNSKNSKLPKTDASYGKIIVTLTSFPLRINKVWISIESILRQKRKPDMIILWLSKEQFKSIDCLPKRLLAQQKRGLIIRFVDGDIKSHKKYYYTLREYPNDILVTIDDDIIYPTTLISQLVELNKIYPTAICCHLALRIQTKDKVILPFNKWTTLKKYAGPSFDIYFGSGGGVLFPPFSLHREVLNDTVFKKYCFYSDDVWLNIMSQLNDTMIVKSGYYSNCLPIIFIRNQKLATTNIKNNENDVQMQAVITYYNKECRLDKKKLFIQKRELIQSKNDEQN